MHGNDCIVYRGIVTLRKEGGAMALTFSGPEVIEMAIRTEENGQKFYLLHAEKTEKENIKSLFQYLADEEGEHIKDFQKLYDIVKETGESIFGDYEEFKAYMSSFADSKFLANFTAEAGKLKDSTDMIEILDFALGFEKETLLFYYGLLDFISEKGKSIVKEIIEQEKKHIMKLGSIKKVVK
jgi:rubrerythrin